MFVEFQVIVLDSKRFLYNFVYIISILITNFIFIYLDLDLFEKKFLINSLQVKETILIDLFPIIIHIIVNFQFESCLIITN
jgi:hypothetical protein